MSHLRLEYLSIAECFIVTEECENPEDRAGSPFPLFPRHEGGVQVKRLLFGQLVLLCGLFPPVLAGRALPSRGCLVSPGPRRRARIFLRP
jgi:hypothetical protein